MKRKRDPFSLTKNEIALVRCISNQNSTVKGIALCLGVSLGMASRILKEVSSKGFVTVSRNGITKAARLSTNVHAQLLSDLLKKEANTPLERIMSYSSMSILFNRIGFDFGSNPSRNTIWSRGRELNAFGLDSKRNALLRDFLEAYADFISREFASKYIPQNAEIIWNRNFQCVFKISGGSPLPRPFLKTAISVLPTFGIKLISDSDYYYFSKYLSELTYEDYFLHTLLIDPSSSTYVVYATLLMLKIRDKVSKSSLLDRAKYYGISGITGAVLRYIDTKGAMRSFPIPPIEEMQEKAIEYGVAL